MRVVQLNYAHADDLVEPAALLDRYRMLTGWSEMLADASAQVSVVQRFGSDARLVRNGIDYRFVREGAAAGRPHRWMRPQQVHRQVAELKPDVVHVNGMNVPAQLWWLRRALPPSTAIVVQDHAGRPPALDGASLRVRASRALRRRAFSVADAFLFSARELAEPWVSAGLVASDRVHAVMAASTAFGPVPRDLARRRSGVTGKPALLWVGRLESIKDPMTVLDGFERLLQGLPHARLSVVHGSGDLTDLVRARVHGSPALRTCVRLIGHVPHDDLPHFYCAADAFVLGSRHESCGLSLIEACACGLPPVVPDIPAFRAITADATIGRLWQPGVAADFARAILEHTRYDPVSERGRVRGHFASTLSPAAIGRRALTSYTTAVTRRRSAQRGRPAIQFFDVETSNSKQAESR